MKKATKLVLVLVVLVVAIRLLKAGRATVATHLVPKAKVAGLRIFFPIYLAALAAANHAHKKAKMPNCGLPYHSKMPP